jgi:hypothetical protein
MNERNELVNELVNELMNKLMNESINELMNGSMNESMNELCSPLTRSLIEMSLLCCFHRLRSVKDKQSQLLTWLQ